MKIKLAIILLGMLGLGASLSSIKAQSYPLTPKNNPCPASVECSIDHQPMYPNGNGGRGFYSHTYFGEYHTVRINCD
jgi:hypothetical protein